MCRSLSDRLLGILLIAACAFSLCLFVVAIVGLRFFPIVTSGATSSALLDPAYLGLLLPTATFVFATSAVFIFVGALLFTEGTHSKDV